MSFTTNLIFPFGTKKNNKNTSSPKEAFLFVGMGAVCFRVDLDLSYRILPLLNCMKK